MSKFSSAVKPNLHYETSFMHVGINFITSEISFSKKYFKFFIMQAWWNIFCFHVKLQVKLMSWNFFCATSFLMYIRILFTVVIYLFFRREVASTTKFKLPLNTQSMPVTDTLILLKTTTPKTRLVWPSRTRCMKARSRGRNSLSPPRWDIKKN